MRILVANFFPAHFPSRSGGEQRYYYLYRQLSAWHDVTLLSANYPEKPLEYVEHSPSFREYRVPKPEITNALHWQLYQSGIGDECSGYVAALGAGVEGTLRARFRELLPYADVVVHESPFTFPLDETAFSDGKPRVYASYNVEHRLAAQMLKGASGREATRFIRFVEGSLARRADLVLATSADEAATFASDFDIPTSRLHVVPNGFEPLEADDALPQRDRPARPFAVFVGSGHPPNVEAARFICGSLAAAVPELDFHIMGAVCKSVPEPLPPNVKLLGFVEEPLMRAELRACAAALNPLFSGAGTNLKMVQYMEAAAAIISTPIGARGLSLEPGVEALIVPPEEFPARLSQLALDPEALRAVGLAGREKARAEYTWRQIAQRYANALKVLPLTVSRGARQRLLHVNDYPVTDPKGGGEMRILQLLRQLSTDFDVELLCLAQVAAPAETRITPNARQHAFPKTERHREAESEADRGYLVSVRDIVAADWILENEAFVGAFRAALPHASAVVLEHPYLAPLLDLVPASIPVIYASQNVEADLKRSLLAGHPEGDRWTRRVAELESLAATRAEAIVCVSEEDAKLFASRFAGKRVVVISNGTESAPSATAGCVVSEHPSALFMGSAHPPNIEAARCIVESIARTAPRIRFDLVGSVCQAISHLPMPPNVVCHGVVTEESKRELLSSATMALNPMVSGGGSSLKVPDFLAAGLPLVSTSVGARGFGLRPGIDYEDATLDEFAARLERLACDPARRTALGRSGRDAVARVTWPVLGSRYRRFLRKLLRKAPASPCRILVATYRVMDPAPGGAEAYLNHTLAYLGARGDVVIDVATCDVGSIQDQFQFSARYGAAPPDPEAPRGLRALHRFALDPPAADVFGKCRQLHSAWMRESCEQWSRLAERIEEPLLLGGWNYAERSGNAVWRWSSLRAQVGMPAGWEAIRIEATAHGRRRVSLAAGSTAVEQDVDGPFRIEMPLGGEHGIVELGVDAALVTADDPRELGVAVNRIALRRGDDWIDIELRGDAEQWLRKRDAVAWVDSLVSITLERDASLDALFLEVRGPHSADMRGWLDRHVLEYDLVIVQGTPFAPIAWVPPIARQYGVPVVLLPHYHVEDRYYHWRSYYDAFRDADVVLVAPAWVRPRFFDRLDTNAAVVPGGGLALHEFTPAFLAACRKQFERIHRADRPFVLVLGRKAAGKHYSIVLDAARLPGAQFDVVMIGPDEDGRPISQPGVHCYGSRPREFVLGALAACACLANMSDSESFGIVLLEAWAAGRPVLAQKRCIAFDELVEDGENGYLVESAEEVLECANQYVVDRALADRHAAAGLERARRLSWESLATRIYDVAVRETARGEQIGPRFTAGADLDARPFVSDAAAATLKQLGHATVHDPDFNAFGMLEDLQVDCILDIGANRGQSVASLHTVLPSARIHCFEANPIFFPVLEEVAKALNGKCTVHRYGLGRREGRFKLYVPWAGGQPWLEESSTVLEYYDLPWVARKFEQRGTLELQEVNAEIRVGDSLGVSPQLIKIDVEGAENEVILGLEQTIRRGRPILLVENSDWHRVTRTLAQFGYEPYMFDHEARRLIAFSGETTNTFYLHPDEHGRLVALERAVVRP